MGVLCPVVATSVQTKQVAHGLQQCTTVLKGFRASVRLCNTEDWSHCAWQPQRKISIATRHVLCSTANNILGVHRLLHKRRFIRLRSNKEAFLIRSVPCWKLHCGRRQAYCTMHGLVQCGEKGVAGGGGVGGDDHPAVCGGIRFEEEKKKKKKRRRHGGFAGAQCFPPSLVSRHKDINRLCERASNGFHKPCSPLM